MAPSARANEKTREVAARVNPSSCVMGKKKIVKPYRWNPPPNILMAQPTATIRQP